MIEERLDAAPVERSPRGDDLARQPRPGHVAARRQQRAAERKQLVDFGGGAARAEDEHSPAVYAVSSGSPLADVPRHLPLRGSVAPPALAARSALDSRRSP